MPLLRIPLLYLLIGNSDYLVHLYVCEWFSCVDFLIPVQVRMRKKRRRLSLEIFGESFRDGSRRVLGAGARRLLRANDTCERLDVITSGIFHRGEDSSSEI